MMTGTMMSYQKLALDSWGLLEEKKIHKKMWMLH